MSGNGANLSIGSKIHFNKFKLSFCVYLNKYESTSQLVLTEYYNGGIPVHEPFTHVSAHTLSIINCKL